VPDLATAILTWLMSEGSSEQGVPSLEELYRRPGWMELAACAGPPIQVFCPAKGQTAAAARAICSTGKVQPECLDYARFDSDTMGFGTERRSKSGGIPERRHRQTLGRLQPEPLPYRLPYNSRRLSPSAIC
jgi:hypothetical protein